jgi:hypothetical protein
MNEIAQELAFYLQDNWHTFVLSQRIYFFAMH